MGASGAVATLAEAYMFPVWLAGPLIVVSVSMSSALQSVGAVALALQLSSVPTVLNAVLCPLLVLGVGPFPRMGIAGAGVATALAWLFSVPPAAAVVSRRGLIGWSGWTARGLLESVAPVLQVAVPAAVGRLAHPLAIATLVTIVARIGPFAVGAFGVVDRVVQFVLIGPTAMGASIHVVASAARGACDPVRMREAVAFGLKASLLWGLVWSMGLAVAADPVCALLTDDPALAEPAALYVRLGCGGLAFFCVQSASNASFPAIDNPRHGVALTIATVWLIQLPVAFVSSSQWGWRGFSIAQTVAQAAIAALFVAFLLRVSVRVGGAVAVKAGTSA